MQLHIPPIHSWVRQISGTPEAVGEAARTLNETLQGFGLSDEMIYAIELCFEELATNILRHGRNPGSTLHSGESDPEPFTDMKVTVESLADRVTLVMEDNAVPFDITKTSTRSIGEPVTQVKPGGLGIHLINQFASSLRHELTDTGNRVTVEFAK